MNLLTRYLSCCLWACFPFYPSVFEDPDTEGSSSSIVKERKSPPFEFDPFSLSVDILGSDHALQFAEKTTGESVDYIPFGPIPFFSLVFPTFVLAVVLWGLATMVFFRVFPRPHRVKYGRTNEEMGYIVFHNGITALMSMISWYCCRPDWALITFGCEIAYEVWDCVILYQIPYFCGIQLRCQNSNGLNRTICIDANRN